MSKENRSQSVISDGFPLFHRVRADGAKAADERPAGDELGAHSPVRSPPARALSDSTGLQRPS